MSFSITFHSIPVLFKRPNLMGDIRLDLTQPLPCLHAKLSDTVSYHRGRHANKLDPIIQGWLAHNGKARHLCTGLGFKPSLRSWMFPICWLILCSDVFTHRLNSFSCEDHTSCVESVGRGTRCWPNSKVLNLLIDGWVLVPDSQPEFTLNAKSNKIVDPKKCRRLPHS